MCVILYISNDFNNFYYQFNLFNRTHSNKIELVKLQTVKQSAERVCIPNRYQPPPTRERQFYMYINSLLERQITLDAHTKQTFEQTLSPAGSIEGIRIIGKQADSDDSPNTTRTYTHLKRTCIHYDDIIAT